MKNSSGRHLSIIQSGHKGGEFGFSLIQALIKAMPYGVLVVEHNNIIAATNERLFEVLDVNPCEIPEAETPDLIGEDDSLLLYRVMERVKEPDAVLKRVKELYAKPDQDDHAEIELKDGRIIERHSTVLRDHDLGYLGRVWFFNDITDHKRNEKILSDLARTDSLTEIPNLRHFTIRADEEFARAGRYGRPLSLVMLDIDHFKDINDKHGHGVGDQVLKALTRNCIEVLRQVDFMARTGGEEFIILMPDTRLSEAVISAERLRKHIAGRSIDTDAGALEITISLGVTTIRTGDTAMTDALKRVDEALYKAKAEGRNRSRTVE